MLETRLLFLSGSTRSGSHNSKLARLAATIGDANGIASTWLDLGDYPLPIYNGDLQAADGVPENAGKLRAVLKVHSGIFIASPEYNASVSPLLKNTLDWISRTGGAGDPPLDVFRTRVFALGAASTSGTGGLRGLIALRHVLELGLGALVLPEQMLVPRAQDAFDDNGSLKSAEAVDRLKAVIQTLARTERLAHG